jgi:flagellar motor switch protein FliN/FliY
VTKGGGAPAAGLRDALLQLPLTVTAVLAEKTLKLKQVLALRPGEIVEFPRRVVDLLELRVSGRPLAEGSAVRIGERFGLRLASVRDGRAPGSP